MKVNRILETALYAEDLEAAEKFYTKVLGLEVHEREVGRHLFFRCGNGMFLIFNPNQTKIEKQPHGCSGVGHVAWAISESEIDPWRDWLKEMNVPIVSEVDWPQGGHSIYFKDPAKNSLELVTTKVWGIS